MELFFENYPHFEGAIAQLNLLSQNYYDKELENLTKDQVNNVLQSVSDTYSTTCFYIEAMIQYFIWCREHKRGWQFYNAKDYLVSRLTAGDNKVLSESEVRYLESLMEDNPQNQAVLRLLFESLSLEEIINLKMSDVNGNELNLGSRVITVSLMCIDFINGSIGQDEYITKNGDFSRWTPEQLKYPRLVENDYIIRPAIHKGYENRPISVSTIINNRLSSLKEVEFYEWFSGKPIQTILHLSGAIYMGKAILEQKGNLEDGDYTKINNKYPNLGDKAIRQNVTIAMIQRLYPIGFFPAPLSDKVYRNRRVKDRSGQNEFRDLLLFTYQNQCAISGESCIEVLEAAHIQPHIGKYSNHVQNGIILRADIHALFDLGLFTLNDDYSIRISPNLSSEYYQNMFKEHCRLLVPFMPMQRPSRVALQVHRDKVFQDL